MCKYLLHLFLFNKLKVQQDIGLKLKWMFFDFLFSTQKKNSNYCTQKEIISEIPKNTVWQKTTNRIDNCKQGKLFMHIVEACCFQNSKTRYYLCCQNQYQIQFVCVLLSIYCSFMCLWTYMLILSVSSFLLYSSSFCTISKFNLLNIRVIYSL